MRTIEGFNFFPLMFDRDGTLESTAELDVLKQHLTSGAATDAIFIAHGFRNDEQDATRLYTSFLKTLGAHFRRPEFRTSLGSRTFAAVGVFWPSQAFRESFGALPDEGGVQGTGTEAIELANARRQLEELRDSYATPAQRPKIERALTLLPSVKGSATAQDDFVALVLSLLDGTPKDPTEGAPQIRTQSGSELLEKLGPPIVVPTERGGDEGGVDAVGTLDPSGTGRPLGVGGFFNSVFGQVGQLLNFTTWYLMKDRAATVGGNGVAHVVRALKASRADVKVHLVGHSLGGRLMAACAKALCNPPMVQPDSLVLLEAAFSHYGFSPNNGRGTPGFFRDVVAKKIVRGPFVSTFSVQDTVVGYGYAIASRLAGDNARAIGDAHDEFGGIGRNGTQKTSEAVQDVLHAVGKAYHFKAGVVCNLDGSGGLIKDHSDVTNETVTYAVASAVALS